MKTRLAVLLTLTFAVVACSKPTIDTTTDETTQASVQKVRESLPEADRAKFDEAMQTVTFTKVDFGKMFSGEAGTNAVVDDVKKALHGKTGPEIIAMAEQIKEQERQAKRAEAMKEIQALQKEKDDAAKARAELVKFQVLSAKFSKTETMFGPESKITMKVKNGTGQPISKGYFRGKLTSPGRSVPWHEDDFNYDIPGGLEPGEEATWNLVPNMFSAWGRVEAPADAVLEVTVVGLDGAGGKTLWSTAEFTKEDEERLAELQREYAK